MTSDVSIAFQREGIVLPVSEILPLKQVKPSIRMSHKYHQVLDSVREVGIIEPLIVFPQGNNTYLLLDGHVRLEVLKQIGESSARCLIATDDESYTYNTRVNRMATIQEHAMILKAIQNGASEERIAKVLRVDVSRIRLKRDLLKGVCQEAAEILKNKQVSLKVFSVLRKMKPMRQIEVAEILSAASNYSAPYAKALLVATPADKLNDPAKHKGSKGLSPEQIAKMEKEMEALQKDMKRVEDSHGNQVLNLVLARGYVARLFSNARIGRYLGQHHADIYRELQTVAGASSLEN